MTLSTNLIRFMARTTDYLLISSTERKTHQKPLLVLFTWLPQIQFSIYLVLDMLAKH